MVDSEPLKDSGPDWLADARPRLLLCAALAIGSGLVGLLAGFIALVARQVQNWSSWSAACGLLAAAALVLAAGAIPAWLLAYQRLELVRSADRRREESQRRADGSTSLFSGTEAEQWDTVFADQTARLRRWAGLPGMLVGLPAVLFALLVAWRCWPAGSGGGGELAIGITALILAFPILVAERHLTRISNWSDAPRLAALCRFTIAALVVGALATLVHALGIAAAVWGQRVVAAVIIAVCAELFIRAVLVPLLPSPRAEQARIWTSSTIADLITSTARSGGFRERFHIDLSQSWALAFLRRITPLLVLLAILGAWATTGITALGLNERGVYERLGRPVAVFGSGLHCHLPWPFGAVKRVELGTIHDLSLMPSAALPHIAAEARPGFEFDRLWDRSHPAESTFVLPGPGAGERGQAYQLVISDVRILWRIGLDDAHAISSAYRIADSDTLVRTLASSLFTGEFSTRALAQIIGSDRDALAGILRDRLQGELDQLDSGVELTAVVIDAIHPPRGAAVSYHHVQAAAIDAATEVSVARSQSNRSHHEADAQAASSLESSRALAAELVSKASIERNHFTADSTAMRQAGDVLLLERWLQALAQALPRAHLTIIDHRFTRDDLPLIDLRPTALPGLSTKDKESQ